LSPQGIINFLELRRPQFEKTAEWGSYGNGFKWDK
jgi:S-adenosylmethionine synthetase